MPEQTHDKCLYFDSKTFCPHRSNDQMKQYIEITSLGNGYTKISVIKDIPDIPNINEIYCKNCDTFKPHCEGMQGSHLKS